MVDQTMSVIILNVGDDLKRERTVAEAIVSPSQDAVHEKTSIGQRLCGVVQT